MNRVPGKLFSGALSALVLAVALSGCSEAPLAPDDHAVRTVPQAAGSAVGRVTALTRNVYVGTDVDRILAATLPEVPARVSDGYRMFLETNAAARAATLAREIGDAAPHCVGLQEVSLVRGLYAGGVDESDFMEALLNALAERGLDYRLAARNFTTDVTLPADPTVFAGLLGVQLIDSDAILVRGDVPVDAAGSADYAARLPVPGAGFDIVRGYTWADVTIGPRAIRFVNTHLESAPVPELLPVQLGQIGELVQTMEAPGRPVVLVGDLNTPAHLGAANAPGYATLLDQGYVDLWMQRAPGLAGDGMTCCRDPGLVDPDAGLDQRIDFVFVRPGGGVSLAGRPAVDRVGGTLDEWRSDGRWASDHAGLLARFVMAPREN